MPTDVEKSSILTMVFTDLVGSTALKVEKGDQAAGLLIAQHRDYVQKLADQHGGRIIDWAGDGCFLTFTSPSASTYFALKLQQWHFDTPNVPKLRTGIHIGEVTEFEKSETGGGAVDVEGLSVDLSARIQSLAIPNQVLMSEAVFNMVRPRVRAEEFGSPVAWRAHGPYELKGFDEPMGICEIGIDGTSPLLPPGNSEKAYRVVSPGEEETLGWRPAVGLEVPTRDRWLLKEKLGEGGYGEVWLAQHEKSRVKRVYKFCFDPEHVRSLKREVVLFRLLKETLGHRDDITELIDWQFEESPFFLESEYSEGGNLLDWIESKGGIDSVPLETRLELVAQIAVALAAAHSVGVLHKDIKPANILISEIGIDKKPQAGLTDFGIGLIMNMEALAEQGITMAGYTNTMAPDETSTSGAGTRLYMAPEVVEGKLSTTRSDIYSLGVILYQMASDNLAHTIAPGWERDVVDEFLREDIAACVDGNPERRISSADELARRLRTLPERREEKAESERIREEALQATEIRDRARRRRQQFGVVLAIGLAVTLVVAGVAVREFQRAESQSGLRAEAESQKVIAENQSALALSEKNRAELSSYYANINLAAHRQSEQRTQSVRRALVEAPAAYRNWEWGYLLRGSYSALFDQPEKIIRMASRIGKTSTIWKQSNANLISTLQGHGSEINDIDVIGNRIVTASDDGTVRLWRIGENDSIRTFGDGKDPLFCVAMSSDFDLVAAGGFSGGLFVWRLSTGEPILITPKLETELLRDSGFIGDIRISDDGSAIYFSRRNQIITVNISNGELLSYFVSRGNLVVEVNQIPDGKGFASVNLGGMVERWEEKNEAPTSSGTHSSNRTAAAATMHMASERAATAYSNGEVVVWDEKSGNALATLDGAGPETTHIFDFSPDGTVIVLPDRDKGAKLYNPQTGSLITDLAAEDHVLRTAVFHPDGRHVIAGTVNGTLLIWEPIKDSKSGDPELLIGHTDTVYNADFSPDSRLLATASFDKTVRVWNVETGQEIAVLEGKDAEFVHVEFSPDGTRMQGYGADHISTLWDTKTFEVAGQYDGDPGRLYKLTPENLRAVDFMGGGALINTVFDDESSFFLTNAAAGIRRLDAKTADVIGTLEDEILSTQFQTISPDGRTLVTTNSDDVLWVFDVATGKPLRQLAGHNGMLTMPNYSPDGKTLVSASFDKTVGLWNLESGTLLHKLEGHTAFVVTARFDEKGERVLTSSGDGTARLWEVSTGNELVRFKGHSTMVINAEFSPDYSRVLTYSWDSTAKIWDLDGRELFTIDMKPDGAVYGEWSPDGRNIVLVGRNGAVRLLRAVMWGDIAKYHIEENADFQKEIEQWIAESNDAG